MHALGVGRDEARVVPRVVADRAAVEQLVRVSFVMISIEQHRHR